MVTLRGVVQPFSLTTPTQVHGLLPSTSTRLAIPIQLYPMVLPSARHLSSFIAYLLRYYLLRPTRFVLLLTRLCLQFVPKIRKFSTYDINMPQLLAYSGYIPYNQSQTCVILSQLIAGFFTQFYLRNYRPRIFKDYSYLVTGAWDGASLLALFILSFAVFGAAGSAKPFP
jgi:hypothetical protein